MAIYGPISSSKTPPCVQVDGNIMEVDSRSLSGGCVVFFQRKTHGLGLVEHWFNMG